jgi:hypothetical protein
MPERWHSGAYGATSCVLQELVRKFQATASIPVLLLTSQVGGLGLTLTAADRVIVVDPSWNPSTDNQAVDRSGPLCTLSCSAGLVRDCDPSLLPKLGFSAA